MYAISAAGVAFSVTRACSRGELTDCSCDNRVRARHPNNWEWGGCSEVIDPTSLLSSSSSSFSLPPRKSAHRTRRIIFFVFRVYKKIHAKRQRKRMHFVPEQVTPCRHCKLTRGLKGAKLVKLQQPPLPRASIHPPLDDVPARHTQTKKKNLDTYTKVFSHPRHVRIYTFALIRTRADDNDKEDDAFLVAPRSFPFMYQKATISLRRDSSLKNYPTLFAKLGIKVCSSVSFLRKKH